MSDQYNFDNIDNILYIMADMMLMLDCLLLVFGLPLSESQIIGEGALRFYRNGEVDNNTATNFNSGIVQIYLSEGVWGNICIESRFSRVEADVICRQLGYGGASMTTPFDSSAGSGLTPSMFGSDPSPTVIKDLSCNSTDISVTQCSFNAITGMDFECQFDNTDVVVTCDPNLEVISERKGNVRLRDGLYSNDGLLEVYCGSQWGTICIEGFSTNAALLACGQLGYNSFKTYFMNTMSQTSSIVPIWYHSSNPLFQCELPLDMTMEYCLTSCNLCPDVPSNSNCSHTQDVVLVCNHNASLPAVHSTNRTIEECAFLNGLPFGNGTETTTSSIVSSSASVGMTTTSVIPSGTSTAAASIPSSSSSSQVPLSSSHQIPLSSSSSPTSTTPPLSGPVISSATIGGIAGSVAGFLIIVALMVIILCFFVFSKRKNRAASSNIINSTDSDEDHHLSIKKQNDYNIILEPSSLIMELQDKPNKHISGLLSSSMIKPTDLKVIEKIGQGEFGVVYRGILTTYEGKEAQVTPVAVKTLKGSYTKTQTDELIVEAEKMIQFDHLNVLSLTGVCVGLLESPCIVMPFMSNGSLLSYLRKEAADLTVSDTSDENLKLDTTKQLLSMCLQVAKGMAYLTEQKFVHRDLAARNCMISADGVIKVADFGLAEDVYTTEYFKQDRSSEESVKLPLKWMALESIHYGKFSEKSDVWSFGVLCWEVFSVGKSPYPGMSPLEVVEMLDSGRRLHKPSNAACHDQSYELILTCWEQSPDKRPHFFELVEKIEKLLAPLADYVDFTSNFARKLSS